MLHYIGVVRDCSEGEVRHHAGWGGMVVLAGMLNDIWTAKINIYEPFIGNLALKATARQSSLVGPDWGQHIFGHTEVRILCWLHTSLIDVDR